MAVIAGICIFISIESFANSIYLQPLTSSPVFYFSILTAVSLFFIFFYLKRGHKIEWIHIAWLTYLLFISVVEEFAFRMMLPILLSGAFGMMSAVLFSNFLFAFIHYVTLRWKLINCVVAFIGGLGFSRLLVSTEDIAILILVHYFFTFLNTPLPPERR
jgi:membrane protease YdiL (CAAX protease family)